MPTRERLALSLLTLAVAAHFAWNAWSVPALLGYDAPGHAAYALSIAREGRLPHPYAGWSTFHPPAWYLAAAAAWSAVEPAGPGALRVALRSVGGAVWLAAGLALYGLLRRLGAAPAVAWTATALGWLVPVSQLAVNMLGNEAFAAACAALALPFVLRLQEDPRSLRSACASGLFAGLALASKYSGAWAVAACAVPFLRRGLDRAGLRALAAAAAIVVAVAGPVYARNLALTGSLLPMTRTREPMRSAEANLVLRPRSLADYVWLPSDCLRRPSLAQVAGRPGSYGNRNPSMASVPCLVYAGLWWDPFGERVPIARHRDGEWLGPALLALGLVPTGLALAGFAAALRELVRTRGRSRDAPLVAMAGLGLASFAAFTWAAPSLAAAKASYLLPLGAPAAAFFARAAGALPRRARAAALAVSCAAALASALVFTTGLVMRPDSDLRLARVWPRFAQVLPGSHIAEAVRILSPGASPHAPRPQERR
jgi:hypothetical protein